MPGARTIAGMIYIISSLFLIHHVSAEIPKISSVFPAGLQQGTQVEINLNGTTGTTPLHGWCDHQQLKVTVAESGKTATISAENLLVPGIVGLRFYNQSGSTSVLPFMVGVLPELNETEPNDTINAEQPTALPCVMNGSLSKSGEVDTFAVSLQAGETFIASIDANRPLGAPMDSVLQILSPQGFVLIQNDDDHGIDPLIEYTASATGVYYVRLFAFPSTPNSTINFAGAADYIYRLTLSTGEFVHHSIATPNIPEYSIAGWNLSSTIRKPEATAKTPGLHLIQTQPTQAIHPGKSELILPAIMHGRIQESNQQDRYSFSTQKGKSYEIRVRARELGSRLDPTLHILDSADKLLKESDDIARDNQDVKFDWKAPSDGTYAVQIFDRYGFASPFHFYELHLRPQSPAFELTTTADNYSVKAGESVEIEIKVNRTGGHNKDIVISAELPNGVTSEPLTCPPKGDNAKSIKVKLTAEQTAQFQGTISISGTSADDQPFTAQVKPPTTGLLNNQQIWLTVVPASE